MVYLSVSQKVRNCCLILLKGGPWFGMFVYYSAYYYVYDALYVIFFNYNKIVAGFGNFTFNFTEGFS